MFDAIILGLGGMGSAAVYHLARRGCRVLGLEQFGFGHTLGSSHGRTRIIRTAYYEHPDYIPLVQRSFALWRQFESYCNQQLLLPCDCVTIGPENGELIAGMRLAKSRLPAEAVQTLSAVQLQKRFGFQISEQYVGEIEIESGILLVDDCVQAHLQAARNHGATLIEYEPVIEWSSDRTTVTVQTANTTYTAAKLVITAGAWASQLLYGLGIPLTVMRQVMTWFEPLVPMDRNTFPIFLLETPTGAFYGLPAIDGHGVKVARHYGAAEVATPNDVNRDTNADDETPVRQFLNQYLLGMLGDCVNMQSCLYTLSPDRHFIIDAHPQYANVSVACGFSGHGFKFAPVVGEILADLAMNGRTAQPIDMFRINRFQ